MADSPSGECPDCGSEYSRLRQHWAMSECGPVDGAKKTYTCSLDGCDNTFEDYPTRRETRGRSEFYCSKECKNKGHRSGQWVNCSWCGSEVYKQECLLEEMGQYSIDHHFCDKECESEFKKANWVLEGHPNWEGGSYGVNAVRKGLSKNSWRDTARKARERDNHTCQMCGGNEAVRAHDVHHIIPVVSGGTNENWNLITLCIPCHRKAEEFTKKFTQPHLLKFAD